MGQIKNYSVSEIQDMLITVHQLSVKTRNEYLEKFDSKEDEPVVSLLDLSDIGSDGYFEWECSNPLFVYLNSLDDDQVKVIQTVMYIGRDHQPPALTEAEMEEYYERKAENPYYEAPKRSLRVADPDKFLSETVSLLWKGKGWTDKSIEINTIMEKLIMLPKYFSRAFEILGMCEPAGN